MTLKKLMETSDSAKTIFWCSGVIKEFHDLGLIERTGEKVFEISIKGLALWDQLDRDWQPTDSMIFNFGQWVYGVKTLFLIMMFKNNREEFYEKIEEYKKEEQNNG
jgi:hypothetical protein